MAKKTTTEVLEIEAGAVLDALRDAGWPIAGMKELAVSEDQGKPVTVKFLGLRFTHASESFVNPKRVKEE